MSKPPVPPADESASLSEEPMWLAAVRAADAKQGKEIRVLDLREVTTFADHFVICSGANARQNQAICNEITGELKKLEEYPNSMEGYENAEWILLDYGDYLIHIFTEKARLYYDLERLWRDAAVVPFTIEPQVLSPAAKKAATKSAAKTPAKKKAAAKRTTKSSAESEEDSE